MHPEELKRLNAKWAIIHCPWDKSSKTNIPKTIVSRLYETQEAAEVELSKRFPNKRRDDYEYAVLKSDGTTIFQ